MLTPGLDRAPADRKRWYWLLIVALIAILMVVIVLVLAKREPSAAACGDSLQSMVDAASPGDTVEVPGDCIYRETVTIDKPLTLRGASGAEIRGSDEWTEWTKSESYWESESTLPNFPAGGKCEKGTSRCKWPEQVFVDGSPLEQVASDPDSGQFAVDTNRKVVLADDPTGHTVEVTTRSAWVVGASSDVVVEDLTMKHAANEPQREAAIRNDGYANWTVQNNVLSDAHGAVVALRENTGLKIIGNDISRGGQLGVHGGKAALEIRDNKIHHNNTEGFASGWEAGGVKNANVSSIVVEGNEVYSNNGPGLWCDVSCKNGTYSNNRVHHNAKIGIFWEISDGAKIFGNTLYENGRESPGWGYGAGICSCSSKNVEIYDNTLAWNADGISVISQDRGETEHDAVTNISVHDNTVLAQDYPNTKDNFALSWLQDWAGGMLFDSPSNNRGENNRYWYPSVEGSYARFKSNREGIKRLSDFDATLGEEGGRYPSQSEKDAVVANKGIPNNPESR